jgi:hypothetical protein
VKCPKCGVERHITHTVRWAGVDIHTWNHDIDSVDCLRKQLAALEAERDIARVA